MQICDSASMTQVFKNVIFTGDGTNEDKMNAIRYHAKG